MTINNGIPNAESPMVEASIEKGELNQMKKKKCRGNRKRQRYRRQLYNQGLDETEVNELVEKKFSSQQLHQPQRHKDKTASKRHDLQNIEVSIPLVRVSFHIF